MRTRVDPDGCAGVAGVSERAGWERGIKRLTEGRLDIPAETTPDDTFGSILWFRHGSHRLATEYPFALTLTAVQEHLGKRRQIIGGGENSGMASHPAEAVRNGVLHFPPLQMAVYHVARSSSGLPSCQAGKTMSAAS